MQPPLPSNSTLVSFHDAAAGSNWTVATNWTLGWPCGLDGSSGWYGVECGEGEEVIGIVLPSNGLRGALSPKLIDLGSLQRLDVFNNSLALSSHTPELRHFLSSPARCGLDANTTRCRGVPPSDCSAFTPPDDGAIPRLSLEDRTGCVDCRHAHALATAFVCAFLVSLSVLGLLSRRLWRWLSDQPIRDEGQAPARTRILTGSISSTAILLGHIQALTLLGSFRLESPTSSRQILAVLGLDPLRLPQCACLMRTAGEGDVTPRDHPYNESRPYESRPDEGAGLPFCWAFSLTVLIVVFLVQLALLLPGGILLTRRSFRRWREEGRGLGGALRVVGEVSHSRS